MTKTLTFIIPLIKGNESDLYNDLYNKHYTPLKVDGFKGLYNNKGFAVIASYDAAYELTGIAKEYGCDTVQAVTPDNMSVFNVKYEAPEDIQPVGVLHKVSQSEAYKAKEFIRFVSIDKYYIVK